MPLKSFCCRLCGACAPKKYLKDGQFTKRMSWLWSHRKRKHPRAHKKSVKKSVATRSSGR